VNKLLIHAVILGLLVVVYAQFVITLKESDELLRYEKKWVLQDFVIQEGILLNIWKKILSTSLEDQNQRHVPVSFWFKRKLFIFMRIRQRIRMMIMPNHQFKHRLV